jgi:hypothetical protein
MVQIESSPVDRRDWGGFYSDSLTTTQVPHAAGKRAVIPVLDRQHQAQRIRQSSLLLNQRRWQERQ